MPYVTSWERIGRQEGEKIGIQKGERKGDKKRQLETAKRMLSRGVAVKDIAAYTDLTEKEIQRLMQ
jgi:predicted transposase/invertase (TIGR01784 family)